MNKALIFIIAVIAVLFIFRAQPGTAQKSVEIGGTKVSVDLATSEEDREKGLSIRSDLPENEGMLFLFDKKTMPSFWMKGMVFPIDIIWLADGKVVDLTEKVPAPGDYYVEDSLPKYAPNKPIDHALEVSAGWAKKNKIKIGDEVKYNLD